jgi:excisionase family DNA binding protein
MERKPLGSRPEVAKYLHVPVATLERWATRGEGPPYRKVGRHTRYDWNEVDRWLAAQQQGGTGGSAA